MKTLLRFKSRLLKVRRSNVAAGVAKIWRTKQTAEGIVITHRRGDLRVLQAFAMGKGAGDFSYIKAIET